MSAGAALHRAYGVVLAPAIHVLRASAGPHP
jgi:hypothetical protein